MRSISIPLAAAATLSLLMGAAHAQTVSDLIVPGSSNPFLAGQPDGAPADGDSAPAQSPLEVVGLNLTSGGYLNFGVTGGVDFGGSTPTDPPDGSFAVAHGQENGLGGYTAPANALVGVFLTNADPALTAAPDDLDFTSGGPGALGTSFASLSPQLKQVFFIGDGMTGNGSGAFQQFFIPTVAARFYLGTVDGSGWFNNSGQFTVTATQITAGGASAAPEPASLALIGLPLAALIVRRRRAA